MASTMSSMLSSSPTPISQVTSMMSSLYHSYLRNTTTDCPVAPSSSSSSPQTTPKHELSKPVQASALPPVILICWDACRSTLGWSLALVAIIFTAATLVPGFLLFLKLAAITTLWMILAEAFGYTSSAQKEHLIAKGQRVGTGKQDPGRTRAQMDCIQDYQMNLFEPESGLGLASTPSTPVSATAPPASPILDSATISAMPSTPKSEEAKPERRRLRAGTFSSDGAASSSSRSSSRSNKSSRSSVSGSSRAANVGTRRSSSSSSSDKSRSSERRGDASSAGKSRSRERRREISSDKTRGVERRGNTSSEKSASRERRGVWRRDRSSSRAAKVATV